MQTPSTSDPAFKEFLDSLKKQNTVSFATQLLELKYQREIAGEDDDKREEQLDQINETMDGVKAAVTGFNTSIDPLITGNENLLEVLQKSLEELALIRKLSEGSLEYDKDSAQYRNISGREITSKVSGKTIKRGGYIDFETAANRLSGQGERVKQSNEMVIKPIERPSSGEKLREPDSVVTEEVKKSFFEQLKESIKFYLTDGLSEKPGTGLFQTPSKAIEKNNSLITVSSTKDIQKFEREKKVSSPSQLNPEADNIQSTQEVTIEVLKSDLEISKEILTSTREQLNTLKEIRNVLAPETPGELPSQKSTPTQESVPSEEKTLLGAVAEAAGNILPGRKPGTTSKSTPNGKKSSLGGKILGGLGKATRFLGPAAAVGAAAYSGIQGYQRAGENFDIPEGQEATTGQKISSAVGGITSGLTFGLVNEKDAAQTIQKAGEFVGEKVSSVYQGAKEMGSKAVELGSSVYNNAKVMGSQAISKVTDTAKNVGGKIAGFFGFKKDNQVTNTSLGTSNNQVTNTSTVKPVTNNMVGQTVSQTSVENLDMSRTNPTVSNMPPIISTSVNNSSSTKYVPAKATPRAETQGSSLEKYLARTSVY